VRHDDHPGAALGQLPYGRQAGPDPAVVGDPGALRVGEVQRHVEVGPQQHAPAGDREVFDGFHFLRLFARRRAVRG